MLTGKDIDNAFSTLFSTLKGFDNEITEEIKSALSESDSSWKIISALERPGVPNPITQAFTIGVALGYWAKKFSVTDGNQRKVN
jgi:hypothetical protein